MKEPTILTAFAFVGSQYHLKIGGEDFFIDQLLYQLKVRCLARLEGAGFGLRRYEIGRTGSHNQHNHEILASLA